MKYVYIVGASGSIGSQTLDIIRDNPQEFKVIGLSLGRDLVKAKKIIEEFKPEVICFRENVNIELSYNPIIYYGDEGLKELSSYKKYDNEIFVNALVGISGLLPTICAIKAKKDILLANKETLVVAGDIIKNLVRDHNVNLIPIDSEHSAILECIKGESKDEIKRLIITASGGSFRDKQRSELINVTKEDALKHPNWNMGAKITIDSATMMNKAFEIIEAHYLFDIPYYKIDTVLHRESIVHSLVEFNDGVIKASLGTSDMHIPIQYALKYPKHDNINLKPLNLFDLSLHFSELKSDRFPCIDYAYYVSNKDNRIYFAVLNAANEAAVKLFLDDKIKFLDIEKIILEYIKNPIYESIEYNINNIIDLSYKIINEIIERYGD